MKRGYFSMIRAFQRSRMVCGAIMAISAVIAVAIWFRDRAYPVFVPRWNHIFMSCLRAVRLVC